MLPVDMFDAVKLMGAVVRVYWVALALNVWFAICAVRVLRERTDAAARHMFRVSLIYLFALFVAMLLDRALLA